MANTKDTRCAVTNCFIKVVEGSEPFCAEHAPYDMGTDEAANDPVNSPSHYTFGKFEVIDVIEDWKLDFHDAQVIKYVARAGKKDPTKTLEDLKKAQFYLNRKIKRMEPSNG